MRYQLELTLRCVEGALARVIGTADRRGFRTINVDGQTHLGEGQVANERFHLRLIVEGERSGDRLQSQLCKLYDCLSVEVSPCQ